MKEFLKEIPREFSIGKITMLDYGKITLNENEMISFKTGSGKEYDFTAKEWGFYATPSINGRLRKEGFKTALVRNEFKKIYIMVVDEDKIEEFTNYLEDDKQKLICWLDEWSGDNI